jgi:hypothetical protein
MLRSRRGLALLQYRRAALQNEVSRNSSAEQRMVERNHRRQIAITSHLRSVPTFHFCEPDVEVVDARDGLTSSRVRYWFFRPCNPS